MTYTFNNQNIARKIDIIAFKCLLNPECINLYNKTNNQFQYFLVNLKYVKYNFNSQVISLKAILIALNRAFNQEGFKDQEIEKKFFSFFLPNGLKGNEFAVSSFQQPLVLVILNLKFEQDLIA